MILIEKADDLKSYLKDNFKAIITVFVILAGLVVGIILANNPQILRSRANGETLQLNAPIDGSNTINATAPSSSFNINFNYSSF